MPDPQPLAAVLARHETGVAFDALVDFAAPLLARYGLSTAEAAALADDPAAADEAPVAVLETARLLWAFFALPDDEQAVAQQTLADALLGVDAGPEDWDELAGLIGAAREAWTGLEPADRARAEAVAYPTLDLQGLLDHPAFGSGGPSVHHAPDDPDALALFARPLIEAADPDDPDAVERAMDEASELWMIAHEPEAERDALIAVYARGEGASEPQIEARKRQGHAMVERFHTLFGAG